MIMIVSYVNKCLCPEGRDLHCSSKWVHFADNSIPLKQQQQEREMMRALIKRQPHVIILWRIEILINCIKIQPKTMCKVWKEKFL